MIDHVGLRVSNAARSKKFFGGALAPLGYALLADYGTALGFGIAPKPDFWVEQVPGAASTTHVCFAAPNRAVVDAFHKAALAAGGRDNGAPGQRTYHPTDYGAFVLDPDGNNIEAVCHQPV